jgi:hypothetical protein
MPFVLDFYDIAKNENKIELHSLQNRPENLRLAFLLVSKTRTNKLFIVRQYTYIVYFILYVLFDNSINIKSVLCN